MVTKKRTATKKAAGAATQAANADEEQRQERLKALREKRKEMRAEPAASKSGRGGWKLGGAGDGDDRKREMVKKLLKKRMAKGGGKADAQGEGLGQFPRLKALLEQGGGESASQPSVDLVDLEGRVTRLENALEEMLKKLQEAKII